MGSLSQETEEAAWIKSDEQAGIGRTTRRWGAQTQKWRMKRWWPDAGHESVS